MVTARVFQSFFSTITNSLVKLMLLCFITRKLTTQEMLLGGIDFVMVKQGNRSEGIGKKITEHAIDDLKEKNCLAIFLGFLQPKSKRG